MTAYTLFPAFVRVFYRTEFAPHVMTLPVKGWNVISGGHPSGTFTNNGDDEVDADDVMVALAALLKVFWTDATTLNNYIIYTMEEANSPAIPRAQADLTVVGTNTDDSWNEAVETIITMRTSAFNKAKYVFLDAPTGGDFPKTVAYPGSGPYFNFLEFMKGVDNPFVGRDGSPIQSFVSITTKLNDKLRAEYHLN